MHQVLIILAASHYQVVASLRTLIEINLIDFRPTNKFYNVAEIQTDADRI